METRDSIKLQIKENTDTIKRPCKPVLMQRTYDVNISTAIREIADTNINICYLNKRDEVKDFENRIDLGRKCISKNDAMTNNTKNTLQSVSYNLHNILGCINRKFEKCDIEQVTQMISQTQYDINNYTKDAIEKLDSIATSIVLDEAEEFLNHKDRDLIFTLGVRLNAAVDIINDRNNKQSKLILDVVGELEKLANKNTKETNTKTKESCFNCKKIQTCKMFEKIDSAVKLGMCNFDVSDNDIKNPVRIFETTSEICKFYEFGND